MILYMFFLGIITFREHAYHVFQLEVVKPKYSRHGALALTGDTHIGTWQRRTSTVQTQQFFLESTLI
jgi:hypothetical protein